MAISITDGISIEAVEACEDAMVNPDDPITTIYVSYGDWAEALITAGADPRFVARHITEIVKAKRETANSSHQHDIKETLELLAGDYLEEHGTRD